MDDEVLDPSLAEALGSAANALRDWGRQRGVRYVLDRPLTYGRSGAIVALVYVTDAAVRQTRKLLLKLDTFPDGPASEFQRLRAALDEAPPEFARRHLTRLAPSGTVAVVDASFLARWEIADAVDLRVHLDVSPAAQARRLPEQLRSRATQAWARYLDDVDPAASATVVVRYERPGHPAVTGRPG